MVGQTGERIQCGETFPMTCPQHRRDAAGSRPQTLWNHYSICEGGNSGTPLVMTKSARTNLTGTARIRRRVEPAPPPIWVKPQLAKLVEKAPDGPDWPHEIKFDGYRMH